MWLISAFLRETKKVLGLNGDAKLGKSEFKKSGCKSLEKKNVWGDTHFFFRPPKLKNFFRKVCRQIHLYKYCFFIMYVDDFIGFLAAGSDFWALRLARTRKTWLKNVYNLFVVLAVKLFPKINACFGGIFYGNDSTPACKRVYYVLLACTNASRLLFWHCLGWIAA